MNLTLVPGDQSGIRWRVAAVLKRFLIAAIAFVALILPGALVLAMLAS